MQHYPVHYSHTSTCGAVHVSRGSGLPQKLWPPCPHNDPSLRSLVLCQARQDARPSRPGSALNSRPGVEQSRSQPSSTTDSIQNLPDRRPRRPKQSKAPKPKPTPTEDRKGCCYGCGAKLQIDVPLAPGFVPEAKFELKLRHKQLDKVLCARCSELCNGAMVPAVEDFTQKLQAQAMLNTNAATQESLQLLGKSLITPEQLRTQLKEVAQKKAVVVLLVDLTDASGTLMSRVRDMVGRNPIVLVGTKMDLLPDGTHPKGVAAWLEDAAARKGLNVISCHLVSSHTGEGVSAVTGKVCRERKGRDVYVVGAANVGKSAFVRAMLKDMGKFEGGNFDPAALAHGKYLPVESPMPGTTLGLIALKAFASGGTLYDTPGVHLHHRVQHMLSPAELKLLHPRKRLAPITPAAPVTLSVPGSQPQTQGAQQEARNDEEGADEGEAAAAAEPIDWSGAQQLQAREREAGRKRSQPKVVGPSSVTGSYNWSDLVRIDVLDAPPSTALAFYGPTSMHVTAQPLAAAPLPNSQPSATSEVPEQQEASRVLACRQSVQARGGLIPHVLQIRTDGSRGPLADIAVSGVPGWTSVWAPGSRKLIRMRVWVPKGVEVFLRPPLPCASPFTADTGDQEEAGDDIDGNTLGALAAEYEGGGAASAINDAAWWEAAIAELEGFDGKADADGMDDEAEEEMDEEVVVRPGRGRGGLARRAGGGGERIIMQATVEDILKRPRLDMALGEFELGNDDEIEGDGEEQEDAVDADEDGEPDMEALVEAPVARPRLSRVRAGGLRGRKGLGK